MGLSFVLPQILNNWEPELSGFALCYQENLPYTIQNVFNPMTSGMVSRWVVHWPAKFCRKHSPFMVLFSKRVIAYDTSPIILSL